MVWTEVKLVLLHQILPFEMGELPWLQYFCPVSTEVRETERSGTNLRNVLQSLERTVLIWTYYKKRNCMIWHSKGKINRKKSCISSQARSGTRYILEIRIHTVYLSKRKRFLTGWEQNLPHAEQLRYQIKNDAWIKILESLGKNDLILVRLWHEVTRV